MPAKSAKRLLHLDRLNSLPQTKATQFKPGHAAHNKTIRIRLECGQCGKELFKTPSQAGRSKKHYCSQGCKSDAWSGTVTAQAIKLHEEGAKLKDIATRLSITTPTLCSLLYRRKQKLKYPRIGHGRAFVRSVLPKACELCGYSRAIDIAHIVPVRAGGKYATTNCYALCPNCHHLFDHELLTEQEKLKLKEIHASRIQ